MFNEFKESGIEVLLGLWFSKTDFMDLKNSIMKDIAVRGSPREGIRFAHPNTARCRRRATGTARLPLDDLLPARADGDPRDAACGSSSR